MKQERFEKVVKGDKEKLIDAWVVGIISLSSPFILLLLSKIDFFTIAFIAFVNGGSFFVFTSSVSDYIDSRKVYWRKME